MKRWRKYVLCLTCICCLGLLTGCGNDAATETEQTAETDDTSDHVNDVTEGDQTTENGYEEQTNAMVDENGNIIDGELAGEGAAGLDSIGDAGADIVDGVGDAGKDVIDGVENAADSLTGNEDQTADSNMP